jgi:competence protein ComEC
VLALWMGLGLLRAEVASIAPPHALARLTPAEAVEVAVHGVVDDDPVELLEAGEPERLVAVVRVDAVRREGAWRPAAGRVRARIQQSRQPLQVGDEVALEGRLTAPAPPGNPGQYDSAAALARQGIERLLMVRPHDGAARLSAARGVSPLGWIDRLRRRWERLLDGAFPPDHAAMLRSIILGQRAALDDGLRRAFVETGTMHILVISGFNVGLLAWMGEGLLRWAGWPQTARLLAVGPAIAGYCALTGAQPPVVRAGVMAGVVLLARWMDRTIDWPNALAAAALAMVWVSPAQLQEPGYQLSVGAVASLLAVATPLQQLGERLLGDGRVQRYLIASLAATLAVWIGLWPLLAGSFHLLSPVSVPANLLLVPLISLFVGIGTAALSVASVWAPAIILVRPVLSALIEASVACVRWCHAVPGGAWIVGRPPALLVIAYDFLLIATLLRRRLRLRHGTVAAAWLLAVAGWLWGGVAARWLRPAELEVAILDVGHGDSLLVRTPRGQVIVIDVGTESAGRFAVLPFLRGRGWSAVDALILTHPDEDHIGGAATLIESLHVRRLLSNGALADSSTGRRLLARAATRGVRPERLSAGMRLVGDGVTFDVLHPPPAYVPGTAARSNDNSLVLRLTHGRFRALLAGDLDAAGVPWLLATGQPLRAALLKVPHHGSDLGDAVGPFLERVDPIVAALSVGWMHRLPAASTLRALEATDARVLLTREQGCLTILTDGRRLRIRPFRGPAWDAPLPP